MILRQITVQNFRNIEIARLDFSEGGTFFFGRNGQGKSNLLEGIGYMTALRSFRTAENRLLVREGMQEAAIGYFVEHEVYGETHMTLRIDAGGKREVHWDGNKVERLADIIGRFPAVVFSSGDIQFIRGSPGVRRRWVDMILSATDSQYFHALQQYHRTMASRNALLKRRAANAELDAFEREMAAPAAKLIEARRFGVSLLNEFLGAVYGRMSGGEEGARLDYRSSSAEEADENALLEQWKSARERDSVLGATRNGPHRDDFPLSLNGHSAARYGSEGQQRSLVIGLRIAEMEYFRKRSNLLPLVLLDDIVGELDRHRRARFWSLVEAGAQVFATGTERLRLPRGGWNFFSVDSGTFVAEGQAAAE